MDTVKSYILTIFYFCSILLQPVLANYGYAKEDGDINTTTRIVYAHGPSSHSNIFTIRPDGSGRRQLTNTQAKDWEPAWSPDGSRIAFTSNRDGDYEIYLMQADGSDIRQITSSAVDSKHPNWSGYLRQN